MRTLGQTLRATRTGQGVSGRALAQRVTISAAYLSDIERDRRVPAYPVLQRLAGRLGLSGPVLWAQAGRSSPVVQAYLRRQPDAMVLLHVMAEAALPPVAVAKLLQMAHRLAGRLFP